MAKAKTRAGKSQHPRVKAGTSKEAAEQRKALFAKAFIANGGNKYQAAVTAGYKPGAGAERAAARLSGDVRVQVMIEAGRNKALQAADVTVDRVLREAGRLAFFDVRKLFNADGTMKPMHELDDDTAAALASVEVDEIKVDSVVLGHTRKVKAWDKNSALEKLMKHLGLYEADNEQVGQAMARVIRVPAKQPEHAK